MPDGIDLGAQLALMFQMLNTAEDRRAKNLDEQITAFPYVNGKLFEEALPIASFDLAMREALLDWSAISPVIFRRAVPEHHGCQGAAQHRRALHHLISAFVIQLLHV